MIGARTYPPGARSDLDADAPLLAACLIVRDEEADLGRCLTSVAGVVDEVVACDTGSTDGTVALARRLGARVVEVPWQDDFAAARNAALACCRARWVLSIDADEVLECADPTALRRLLAAALLRGEPVAWSVAITNVSASALEPGLTHVATRLLRPDRCRWHGRVHEQVVARADGRIVDATLLADVRIVHHGYEAGRIQAKRKVERNLRLAEADLAALGRDVDRGVALLNLGRALWAAGDRARALTVLEEAAGAGKNPTARREAITHAVRVALELGHTDHAGRLLEGLDEAARRSGLAARLRAEVALAAGDGNRALAALEETARANGSTRAPCRGSGTCRAAGLERWPQGWVGVAYSSDVPLRIRALWLAGREEEAIAELLASLRATGTLPVGTGLVVDLFADAGRPLREFASLLPSARLPHVVTQALLMWPEAGDALLDALWTHHAAPGASRAVDDTLPLPDARQADGETRAGYCAPHSISEQALSPEAITVLSGASLIAKVLPPSHAATWSGRLRRSGLASLCPLVGAARDESLPGTLRAEAALEALRRFGDPAAAEALVVAAPAVAEHRADAIAETIARIDPELAARFVAARQAPLRRLAGPPRSSAPRVSIVMLCHGKAELTLRCLERLAETLPSSLAYELVVLDNASPDATPSVLESLGGDVLALRAPTNLGFARGSNVAAAHARGEVLVFLNNDTEAEPGWLEAMLTAIEEAPDVGAVGALLRAPSGAVAHAGVVLGERDGLLEGRHRLAGLPADHPEALAPCEVAAATAAALAVRRCAFEQAGGFHEGYWNGNEDVDLCLTLRWQGWRIRYEPTCRLVHDEGATQRDVARRVSRPPAFERTANEVLLTRRWLGKLLALAGWAPAPQQAALLPNGCLDDGPLLRWTRVIDAADRALMLEDAPPGGLEVRPLATSTDDPRGHGEPDPPRTEPAALRASSTDELHGQGVDTPERLARARRVIDALAEGSALASPIAGLGARSGPGTQGAARSASEFVVFLGPDEELDPRGAALAIRALEAHPRAGIAWGAEDERLAHGWRANPRFKPQALVALLDDPDLATRGLVFRRAAVDAAGGIREELGALARYDLALRVAALGWQGCHVCWPTVTVRRADHRFPSRPRRLPPEQRRQAEALRESQRHADGPRRFDARSPVRS